MSRLGGYLAMAPGVGATLLIGSEILYVAFFADAQALALYPWGDAFGWAYQSKYHYLFSGLLWITVAWMPYLGWRAKQAARARLRT